MCAVTIPYMPTAATPSRRWLGPTAQLDLSHPKIYITAQKLTQARQSLPARAQAIHEYVRRLPFGAYPDANHLCASEVLRSGRGDCHAKGVLFTALCRAAGLPARLNFVRVRTRFLHGILDDGPDSMAHAVGQVLIEGRWVATDGYVVDPVLFAHAKQMLKQEGADGGWGIVRGAAAAWDGRSNCLHQFAPEDIVHDYGNYDDPAEFYAELSKEEGAPSWMSRLKYSLGAKLVNSRVARLRRVQLVAVPA